MEKCGKIAVQLQLWWQQSRYNGGSRGTMMVVGVMELMFFLIVAGKMVVVMEHYVNCGGSRGGS